MMKNSYLFILITSILAIQPASSQAIDYKTIGKTTLLALSGPAGYALGKSLRQLYDSTKSQKLKKMLKTAGAIGYGSLAILIAYEAVTTSDRAEAFFYGFFATFFGGVSCIFAEMALYEQHDTENQSSYAIGEHALQLNNQSFQIEINA